MSTKAASRLRQYPRLTGDRASDARQALVSLSPTHCLPVCLGQRLQKLIGDVLGESTLAEWLWGHDPLDLRQGLGCPPLQDLAEELKGWRAAAVVNRCEPYPLVGETRQQVSPVGYSTLERLE